MRPQVSAAQHPSRLTTALVTVSSGADTTTGVRGVGATPAEAFAQAALALSPGSPLASEHPAR
jgi:hypothetical protein